MEDEESERGDELGEMRPAPLPGGSSFASGVMAIRRKRSSIFASPDVERRFTSILDSCAELADSDHDKHLVEEIKQEILSGEIVIGAEGPLLASGVDEDELDEAGEDDVIMHDDRRRSTEERTRIPSGTSLKDVTDDNLSPKSPTESKRKSVEVVRQSPESVRKSVASSSEEGGGGDRREVMRREKDESARSSGVLSISAVQQRVVDSEVYAIYFKMIRMGVPIGAVKTKMKSKGLNPQIVELGEFTPMNQVRKLEADYAMEIAAKSQLQGANNNNDKTRKGMVLRWEENHHQAGGGETQTTPTIWTEIAMFSSPLESTAPSPSEPSRDEDGTTSSETVVTTTTISQTSFSATNGNELDNNNNTAQRAVEELLRLHFIPPRKEAGTPEELAAAALKQKSSSTKRKAQAVLEGKRSQAIAIGLKKIGVPAAKIIWCLREMNEAVLTKPVVDILCAIRPWPVSEQEYRGLQASSDCLGEIDAIVWLFIDSVPDVEVRVQGLAFRYALADAMGEAFKSIAALRMGITMLRGELWWKRFLRVALDVGNRLNAESGVRVRSVALVALTRLTNTKSLTDKSFSLMDAIVKIFVESEEASSGRAPSSSSSAAAASAVAPLQKMAQHMLDGCANARRVDFASLAADMKEYRVNLESLRKIPQLEAFARGGLTELFRLDAEFLAVRGEFEELLRYYGYFDGELDAAQFFGTVITALECVRSSFERFVADAEKRRRALAAAAHQQQQSGKRDSPASSVSGGGGSNGVGGGGSFLPSSMGLRRLRTPTDNKAAMAAANPPPRIRGKSILHRIRGVGSGLTVATASIDGASPLGTKAQSPRGRISPRMPGGSPRGPNGATSSPYVGEGEVNKPSTALYQTIVRKSGMILEEAGEEEGMR